MTKHKRNLGKADRFEMNNIKPPCSTNLALYSDTYALSAHDISVIRIMRQAICCLLRLGVTGVGFAHISLDAMQR